MRRAICSNALEGVLCNRARLVNNGWRRVSAIRLVSRLSAFVQPQVLLKNGNGRRDRVRPANLLKLGPDLAVI